MEDNFHSIASLLVYHDCRGNSSAEPWDDYVVTVELRTFLVRLSPIDDDGFEATISETMSRRHDLDQVRHRVSTLAPTWYQAYAQALTAIITGVVTGAWSDEPPPDLLRFPERSR